MTVSTKKTLAAATGTIDPGKIDLGHQLLLVYQTERGLGKPLREQRPGDQAREDEHGVREALGGDLGESAEDEREDRHQYQGLNDRPGAAQNRLLVPHRDVAPDQEPEQFPGGPQLLPVDGDPPLPGDGSPPRRSRPSSSSGESPSDANEVEEPRHSDQQFVGLALNHDNQTSLIVGVWSDTVEWQDTGCYDLAGFDPEPDGFQHSRVLTRSGMHVPRFVDRRIGLNAIHREIIAGEAGSACCPAVEPEPLEHAGEHLDERLGTSRH